MPHTAAPAPNLSRDFQQVAAAWRALGCATRQLLVGLLVSLTRRTPPSPASSARQQADKLRAYADTLQRSDPGYAQDLHAAANRHELATSGQ